MRRQTFCWIGSMTVLLPDGRMRLICGYSSQILRSFQCRIICWISVRKRRPERPILQHGLPCLIRKLPMVTARAVTACHPVTAEITTMCTVKATWCMWDSRCTLTTMIRIKMRRRKETAYKNAGSLWMRWWRLTMPVCTEPTSPLWRVLTASPRWRASRSLTMWHSRKAGMPRAVFWVKQ